MMMLRLSALIALFLAPAPEVEGSFLRDVIRKGSKKVNRVEKELLAKAVPLDDYRAQIRSQGYDISDESRRAEEDNNEADDYYMDSNYMVSFSGYAMKYAECQPVQKFSEDAIEAGEYTPMVTDDIVILRLCPNSSCSSGRTYGCHYNFAEFAIGISDYVRIMTRYNMDKEQQLCDWCEACAGRRILQEDEEDGEDKRDEEENDEKEEQEERNEDEQEQQEQQNEAEEDENENKDQENEEEAAMDDAAVDDAYVAQDDAYVADADDDGNDWWAYGDDANNWWGQGNDDDNSYNADYDTCNDFESSCFDSYGNSVCDDDAGDDGYLDLEGYMDYLDCTNVNGYYLRPRCDGYEQTISMGIYYDRFCSQYAGDKMNIRNLGLGFRSDAFESFYTDVQCLDCSETQYPPYFTANSNMCNKIVSSSASCSQNMQYDMLDSSDSSTEDSSCSYIESLRFGTYDEEGQLYSKATSKVREVTPEQKLGLVVSLVLCALLAVYSCYLHHSITNLLIKSLSHTNLLPSTRGMSRRRSRRSRRRPIITESEESDGSWDKHEGSLRDSSRSNSIRR